MYKIRQSRSGKLHLSGGHTTTRCSAGTRGMVLVAEATPKNAFLSFPKEWFCKKCFGSDPYYLIRDWIRKGLLENK